MKTILLIAAISVVTSLRCLEAQPNNEDMKGVQADDAARHKFKEVAVIETSKGEMVVEFWPDVAPKTVDNFKKLVREKFYDGTVFHRVVRGFAIVGGDPLTKDPAAQNHYGTGGPGYAIKAELNDRKHERGVLSMVHSVDPESAGSQFAICLERAPLLDHKFTAFGKLIKGEDVLLKIGDVPTKLNQAKTERSLPIDRLLVESIRIVPADSVK